MTVHCKRLADLSTQSAAIARELAVYHGKLANGATATPPQGGARLQSGRGAPDPTAKQLDALAANARTSSDHRVLQDHFAALAKRYTTAADDHAAVAQAYRGTRTSELAVSHDRLAALAREEAKEATAAAEMHKELAGANR
jgi:hypothetical protein